MHREVRELLRFAGIEDRDNVRVLEPRCSAGLELETTLERLRLPRAARQELERHAALQRELLRLVDDAHAALPERPDETVVRDRSADLNARAHARRQHLRRPRRRPLEPDDQRQHVAELIGELRVLLDPVIERNVVSVADSLRCVVKKSLEQRFSIG